MAETEVKLVELKTTEIQPSPYQIREVIEDEEFQELVKSIQEKGVIQPIIVRMVAGKPELVAGGRRLAASRSAGKDTIPAIIREISDAEAIVWSIAENLHRTEPTPLELARIFEKLTDDFYGGNPNRVAEQIGKGVNYVNDRIAILDMPKLIQQMSQELGISRINAIKKITEPKEQIKMAEQALKDNLTAEEIVRLSKKPPKIALGVPSIEERVRKTGEIISNLLDDIVNLNLGIQADELVQTIENCAGFQENLVVLMEEVEHLKDALGMLAQEHTEKITKNILRLFVGLKWLNTAAEKEKKEKRPETIETIRESPFFQKNLQALIKQIEILTSRVIQD